MGLLRYSINVTQDGSCDHRVIVADRDLHRHAVENLEWADARIFGRVTYEMMEARVAAARADSSGTGLDGALRPHDQRREECGVTYEYVVHLRLAGHGPTPFAGLSKHVDLKLVSRVEFASGAVAMRYEPRTVVTGIAP